MGSFWIPAVPRISASMQTPAPPCIRWRREIPATTTCSSFHGTGNFHGTLSPSSDATGLPRTATLAGVGVTPTNALAITSSPLKFPDTLLGGDPAIQHFIVTNTGGLPQADINILVGDVGATPLSRDFIVKKSDCPNPLQYRQSCDFTVAFGPSALGPSTTYLNVYRHVDLVREGTATGNGVAVATRTLVANPASVTFPDQKLGGQSDTQDIT